ncbi:MAG TPA: PhnD/SsuA/transferrin family substrate-binding protein [Chloroflexia bacterium]|nr:PhnD/SsuA/transferrin family substrate-binding protein [Chloroflexia bacterium]
MRRALPSSPVALLGVAILFLLAGCGGEQPVAVSLTHNLITGRVDAPALTSADSLYIGFDRRLEPKEDVLQIASLAAWLEGQTGLSIGVSVTPRGSSVVDDLCAGRVDFAAVGTVSYLQSNDQCGARILLRGRNAEGQDTYKSAIIVRAGSPIHTVADLRGRAFAFGAPNSTQGHLIPRLMLEEAGVSIHDLSVYAFHDSHAATANAVTSGRYEAGALQDTLARELEARGLVRIVAYSGPYPSSGIVAGPQVPSDTARTLIDALLRFDPLGDDAESVHGWSRTEMPGGFVTARDGDYAGLREIARTIGLLER